MFEVINPATLEVISTFEEDTTQSIKEKFSKVKKAQINWQETALSERKKIIQVFADLLVKNQESLAQTLSKEMGKPISQSRVEISASPDRIRFFLDHFEQVMKEEVVLDVKGKMQEKITYEPLGVVAHISVWNYPFFVGLNVLVPALLTGNALIYKPSEYTTLTGHSLHDLFYEAKLPKDLIQVVIGKGRVGAELLKMPFNGVFFTGSYETGKKISEQRASFLTKLQLELGGKDPAYVCDDLETKKLALAAKSLADGAFYNAGQSCCAIERIYVHEKVYEEFLKTFVKTVGEFVVGDPLDEKTYLGPVSRKEQLQVLEDQVKDALQKGAQLKLGGKREKFLGNYFQPSILVDVHHQMKIMREESFGPVIGIQKVRDDEEALELMQDTDYGLTASVYCQSPDRAEKILKSISTGTVYWNCCDRVSPRLPWSGRKHSGIGATLSREGIRTFLQPKAWHLKG